MGFLLTIRRAVIWVRSTRAAEDLWPLAFLTFVLLYNLTESAILAYNDIIWLLYVAVVLSTAARVAEARKRDRSALYPSGTTRLKMAKSIPRPEMDGRAPMP